MSVINPAEEVVLNDFQVFGRTIYASKLPGHTTSELAQAIAGEFSALGKLARVTVTAGAKGATSAPTARLTSPGDPLRLEIWSRRTHQAVAVVAQYDVSKVSLGETGRGRFLALTPITDASGALQTLQVESTYARGLSAGNPRLPDTDGDGRPDSADRCLAIADFGQADADHDGFGNACDADVDQDLHVTSADVAAIQACNGADLGLGVRISEPAGRILEAFSQPQPDPDALALAKMCGPMDLDSDRDVDDIDVALAQATMGSPPGPSGLTDNRDLCGPCDDGLACTLDYCDAAAGVCRHVAGSCDDGDPCTSDLCTADGSCSNTPIPDGTSCEDGDLCTTGEICLRGLCGGGGSVSCDDGDLCTVDSCSPTIGCVSTAQDCNDGLACTLDTCDPTGGGCVHDPVITGDPSRSPLPIHSRCSGRPHAKPTIGTSIEGQSHREVWAAVPRARRTTIFATRAPICFWMERRRAGTSPSRRRGGPSTTPPQQKRIAPRGPPAMTPK